MKLAAQPFALISAGFAIAVGTSHCRGSVGAEPTSISDAGYDGGAEASAPEIPLVHFSGRAACRASRPSGPNEISDAGFLCDADAGLNCQCTADSQCVAGTNGRCIIIPIGGLFHCDYDECFTDSDCPSGTECACGDLKEISHNACVPFNCATDTDCDADGYCSPTIGDCGFYSGDYVGIYCRTKSDDCVNDGDCVKRGGGSCAYEPEVSKWTCQTLICAG